MERALPLYANIISIRVPGQEGPKLNAHTRRQSKKGLSLADLLCKKGLNLGHLKAHFSARVQLKESNIDTISLYTEKQVNLVIPPQGTVQSTGSSAYSA
jgi:hypothetical protein